MEEVSNHADTEIQYLSYDFIEPVSISLYEAVDMMASQQWRDVFEAINLLRSINKFRWEEFRDQFHTFVTPLAAQLDSPRSGLVRNALLLCTELFLYPREGIEHVLITIIPLLFSKSINEKSFIRNQAIEAINFACQYESEQLVRILADHCFHKNAAICDIAISKLEPMLPNTPVDLRFHISIQLLNGKRAQILQVAGQNLRQIREIEGSFDAWVQGLDQDTQAKVIIALEERNQSRDDIRAMIREQRKKGKKKKKGKKTGPEFELVEKDSQQFTANTTFQKILQHFQCWPVLLAYSAQDYYRPLRFLQALSSEGTQK